MRREVIGFAGAFVLGALVACSGGPGPSTDARGGPDGVPPTTTDTPGDGREGPGTDREGPGTGREPPGASGQDGVGNCMSCDGTYACTAPQLPTESVNYITLTSTGDGCGTLDGQGNVSALLECGGTFFQFQNGNPVPSGTWMGGTGHFTVTGTVGGITIVIDCIETDNPPPPTVVNPQTGGTTVDAG